MDLPGGGSFIKRAFPPTYLLNKISPWENYSIEGSVVVECYLRGTQLTETTKSNERQYNAVNHFLTMDY